MPARFAVNLERVLVALERLQGPPREPVPDVLVAWEDNSLANALQCVKELRYQGLKVVTAMFEYPPAKAKAEARSLGASRVIYFDKESRSEELSL